MYEAVRPGRLAGFAALDRARGGGAARRRAPGAARGRGVPPGDVPARRWRCPSARGRDAHRGMAITHARGRSGSAWRSPTPCCCASCRTATGSSSTMLRRHVHRRHRRLPRRALVRHAAAGAADLAEQDGRGARRSASSAPCWPSGAPGSTRTGWRGGQALLLGVAVGVAAPLGDLFESKVKRDAGDEGRRHAVRRPRRRAGPPGRRVLHARRRVLRLAGADVERPRTAHRERERKRDRQMIELLNELRVALPGRADPVRASCSPSRSRCGFDKLTAFQRDVYYVTLIATLLLDGAA